MACNTAADTTNPIRKNDIAEYPLLVSSSCGSAFLFALGNNVVTLEPSLLMMRRYSCVEQVNEVLLRYSFSRLLRQKN